MQIAVCRVPQMLISASSIFQGRSRLISSQSATYTNLQSLGLTTRFLVFCPISNLQSVIYATGCHILHSLGCILASLCNPQPAFVDKPFCESSRLVGGSGIFKFSKLGYTPLKTGVRILTGLYFALQDTVYKLAGIVY